MARKPAEPKTGAGKTKPKPKNMAKPEPERKPEPKQRIKTRPVKPKEKVKRDPSTPLRSAQDDTRKAARSAKEDAKKKRDLKKEPLTTAEWRKIRIEYVKGKTTYQKLAEKYGISASNIRKRASKEAWGKKKRNLDTKVEQKVLERVCDARAKEFELIAQVNDSMDEILSNLVKFVSDQPPHKYDDLRGVESLTKAIAQVVQTKRDLYNVPTEIDRAKIETLRDKQKLEREKFAKEQAEKAASKVTSEGTMFRVVIEGAEEEQVVLDG